MESAIQMRIAAQRQPCAANRLLIVDDEPVVRETFRRVITYSLKGCVIDLAANGKEAVESFHEWHQGVLLLDLKMPIMDGETAFRKIMDLCQSSQWEEPSVLFCTGYVAPDSIRGLLRKGSHHSMLQKPVRPDDLIEALRIRLAARKDALAL